MTHLRCREESSLQPRLGVAHAAPTQLYGFFAGLAAPCTCTIPPPFPLWLQQPLTPTNLPAVVVLGAVPSVFTNFTKRSWKCGCSFLFNYFSHKRSAIYVCAIYVKSEWICTYVLNIYVYKICFHKHPSVLKTVHFQGSIGEIMEPFVWCFLYLSAKRKPRVFTYIRLSVRTCTSTHRHLCTHMRM